MQVKHILKRFAEEGPLKRKGRSKENNKLSKLQSINISHPNSVHIIIQNNERLKNIGHPQKDFRTNM